MVLAASQRVLARLLVVASVALVVSCGNDEPQRQITVGAGDSIESSVLAEIYAGALARTGARTAVDPGLGSRADYLAALDADRVQVVGEHTGALLAHLDERATVRLPKEVAKAVSAALPEGLVVSDLADGTDLRPRVSVTAQSAARDRLRSVGDLTPRCGGLTVGVASMPGLLPSAGSARVAGCDFAATVAFPDPAALRNALLDGRVQAGLFVGPPELAPGATDGLAVLSDGEYAVRAENVLPLFREGLLDQRQIKKLNYVAGELTTDELAAMIRAVRDDGTAPSEVARAWLDKHAL
ncbi:glycine betaine ABC transporter substrate-binding protein [Nocardia sp. CDC186]|uniref:Glycine betaine ABC transporter substrate-binding protein n=1 Tax=Nocardia implantans TaxID=3108168 RepID=A0ABU6B2D0_9NOCA|nr:MULTISPECIES: glycine betaine ABC transporter substrate-binding protein [unclassified Nocardia]MBF6195020.1 transporter [Nocardia beijingensis]MEA3530319.1 glycine betaine ABC transporter substrate-binding protein [Nocardia sp. CDC192]MEB3513821.1 glycine betaine ABC transporter substrate-binding protein [Nocardia sp. CDC186]